LPHSRVNISEKKLLNSSFEKLESDQAVLTGTKTKTLGLGSNKCRTIMGKQSGGTRVIFRE
jgi:hypothetical protein